jgi:hypothetical protein
MPSDYTSNFAALLTGHLGLPGEGGATTPTASNYTHGHYDDLVHAREMLTNFIGKGYKNLSDEQSRKDFAYLKNLVGNDQANKLINSVFVFNNSDSSKGKSWKEKIDSFYSAGSKDPATQKLITTFSTLGQGAIAGATDSRNISNMEITGRKVGDKNIVTNDVGPSKNNQ